MFFPREMLRPLLVSGVLLGLMALGVLLSGGLLQTTLFVLFCTGAITLSAAVWPEALVMAYLFAGRYGYEARLAPFDSPLSLNQMLLVGLVALAFVNARQIVRALRSWTLVTLLLFSIGLTLGLGWSHGINYGLYKVSRTWLVILPGILIAGALIERRRSLIPLVAAAFFVGFMLNSAALVTLESSMNGNYRLSALGSGPNVFSRTVGFAMMIALLSMMWVFQKRDRTRLDKAVLVLCGLSVFWLLPGFVMAQSRGPAIALLAALLLVMALSLYGSWRGLLGGLALTGTVLWTASWIIGSVLERSRFDLRQKSNQASVDVRIEHLWDTWDLIIQHPVLGVGTGAWPVQVFGIDVRAYPHNFFAEIAVENGLPLILFVTALFAFVVGRGFLAWVSATDPAHRFVLMGTMAGFVFFLINISITGDSIDNRLIWLMMVSVELATRLARETVRAPAVVMRRVVPVAQRPSSPVP